MAGRVEVDAPLVVVVTGRNIVLSRFAEVLANGGH